MMAKKFFDEELYKKSPITNLIIFCIYSITARKEKCTFEKLVQECFSLFPKFFAFSHLSKWPDSRKLDRPLRALRKKKFIKGAPQTFFSLTKAGKRLAEEISKTLGQRKLQI